MSVPAQPLLRAPSLVDDVVAVVRRAASARAAVAHRPEDRPGAAPAVPPWRPQAPRSGPTCLASGRCAAAARSASAAPAPAAHQLRAGLARASASAAGSPPAPTARSPASEPAQASSPPPSTAVCSASGRPTSSTATAVSDRLCTPTPTTIIQIASSKRGDRRADRPHLRRKPRSYQVTLGGLGKAAATQRRQVSPRATFRNRVSRRQPESQKPTGRHHAPRMTVSPGMSPDPNRAARLLGGA